MPQGIIESPFSQIPKIGLDDRKFARVSTLLQHVNNLHFLLSVSIEPPHRERASTSKAFSLKSHKVTIEKL